MLLNLLAICSLGSDESRLDRHLRKEGAMQNFVLGAIIGVDRRSWLDRHALRQFRQVCCAEGLDSADGLFPNEATIFGHWTVAEEFGSHASGGN